MTNNSLYQLVITQGYNSFDTFRYLSDKAKVITTIANIRCKCNDTRGLV